MPLIIAAVTSALYTLSGCEITYPHIAALIKYLSNIDKFTCSCSNPHTTLLYKAVRSVLHIRQLDVSIGYAYIYGLLGQTISLMYC